MSKAAYRDHLGRPFVAVTGMGVVSSLAAPAVVPSPRHHHAMVYDSAAQEVVRHQTRTNTAAIFDMMNTDLLNVLLQARISAAVKIPIRQFEAATVLHYSVGEEITPHFDFIDPDSADYENQIRTAAGSCRISTPTSRRCSPLR